MADRDQPPLFGKRLLPCVLDDTAEAYPQRVFAAIAKTSDVSDGFQDVEFQQIANAVNHVAHRLQAVFGSKLEYKFETMTYIGPPDLRYNIVFYAAVKCGYKVSFDFSVTDSKHAYCEN